MLADVADHAGLIDRAAEQSGFFGPHSGTVTIVILCALILGTLLIIVPQLLRANQRSLEMQHTERMRALEAGMPLPPVDDLSRLAGRMALLVPIVVICAAATVTCFLVTSRSDNVFAVSLSVWCVGGVVALAAITGGVALMGRLAHVSEDAEDELPESPRKDEG